MSPKPAPAGGAAVDALLDPAFLENAMQQPMAEVRRLRRDAEQQEVNLSYTRRLLQGRLDIVRRELQRRAEDDGRSLVDLLPEILSEKGRGPAHGLGRHQTVQPHAPEEYESWVNSLTPGVDLSSISALSDAKLEKAARALAQAESGLSERRRGVQQAADLGHRLLGGVLQEGGVQERVDGGTPGGSGLRTHGAASTGVRSMPSSRRASAVLIGGRWAIRASAAARATSWALSRTGSPGA